MPKAKLAVLTMAAAFGVHTLPALAAEGADASFDQIDPARIAGQVLTDENLSLLFGFLRESTDAAAQGRRPPQFPAELVRRMDEAGQKLRREGAAAARSMLDALEAEIRRSLREDLRD